MIGVYKIESLGTPSRVYIGSSKNVNKRIGRHKNELSKNKHNNRLLQRHYNKHGVDDLKYTIITKCSDAQLIETEQFYIDLYEPFFNILPLAGTSRGFTFNKTQESIEKTRQALKGRKLTPEHRAKLSEAKRGTKLSEEHKNKISKSLKGRKKPPGFGEIISIRNKEMGIVPPSRKGKKRITNLNTNNYEQN